MSEVSPEDWEASRMLLAVGIPMLGMSVLPVNDFDFTLYFATRPCGMARAGCVKLTYVGYVGFPANNVDFTSRFTRGKKYACTRQCYLRLGISAKVSRSTATGCVG